MQPSARFVHSANPAAPDNPGAPDAAIRETILIPTSELGLAALRHRLEPTSAPSPWHTVA